MQKDKTLLERLETIRALRIPNFRLFWVGNALAFFGIQMRVLAQSWLVLDLTDSAFYLGLAGFAMGIPVVLVAPLAGVVADRMQRRGLLMAARTGLFVLAVLTAILIYTHSIQVWHILALAVLTGIVMAFNGPATQTFIYDLVGEDSLLNAISLNNAALNLASIAGPSIGGVLVGALGVAGCYLVAGGGNLAAVLFLTLIPVVGLTGVRSFSLGKDVMDGFAYVRSDKRVLWLLCFSGVPPIFASAVGTLMPIFARDILQVGAKGLGLLMSMSAFGALLGVLIVASLGNMRRKGQVFLWSGLIWCMAAVIFALSRWFSLSMACQFIMGVTGATWGVALSTLLMVLVPDEVRGRVMSIHMMTMNITPLGQMLAGGLASFLGAPAAVAFGCSVAGFLHFAALVWVPTIRRLE